MANNNIKELEELLSSLEEKTEQEFGKYQKKINPAHQWDHVKRVIKITDMILDYEKKANQSEVKIAAILHDIGRHYDNEGDHSYWSAEKAQEILNQADIRRYIKSLKIDVGHVIKIIKNHSKLPEQLSDDLKNDLELKILTDADKIDSFGALGILRAPLDERYQKSYKDQVDHIKDKANPEKYILQTNGGMEVGKRYKDYLNDFLKEYFFQKNQFEK